MRIIRVARIGRRAWPARLFKTLGRWAKKNLPGSIFGLVFGLAVNLAVWPLVYFGYIHIGLPSRFDYESINHQLSADLPPGYHIAQKLEVTNFRGPDTKTAVVVASNPRFINGAMGDPNYGDILYLYDKKGQTFTRTFTYRPSAEGETWSGSGYYVGRLVLGEFVQSGSPSIVVGWTTLGAGSQPFVILTLTDNDGYVKVAGVDRIDSENKDQYTFPLAITNNMGRHEQVRVTTAKGFYINDSSILAFNESKSSFVCSACIDEQSYIGTVYYRSSPDDLSAYRPLTFKSYTELSEYASQHGFK